MASDAGESAQRYAARMVYLTEEDEGTLFGGTTPEPMGRTLKPPVLFMSRRQARADSALCAVSYPDIHLESTDLETLRCRADPGALAAVSGIIVELVLAAVRSLDLLDLHLSRWVSSMPTSPGGGLYTRNQSRFVCVQQNGH